MNHIYPVKEAQFEPILTKLNEIIEVLNKLIAKQIKEGKSENKTA